MIEFWNERYAEEDYAYGKEPNEYLRSVLAELKPGKILFPAEGEGRNAVYAAELGWEVFAFDQSEEAREKALKLAEGRGVEINYEGNDLQHYKLEENSFDAVALIFVHLDPSTRNAFHQALIDALRPGGYFILEAFSKAHLQFNSVNPSAGGPKNEALLFSKEEISGDLSMLDVEQIEEQEVELKEGKYHYGTSSVIRCIAQKN